MPGSSRMLLRVLVGAAADAPVARPLPIGGSGWLHPDKHLASIKLTHDAHISNAEGYKKTLKNWGYYKVYQIR